MQRGAGVLIVAGLAIALGGVGGCHLSDPQRVEERREFVIEHAGALDIDVTSGFGDVDVAPHGTPLPKWAGGDLPAVGPGQVLVVALVGSRDAARIPLANVEPALVGGVLTLRETWPATTKKNLSEGTRYAVRAGAIDDTRVRTDFGDIRVQAATGHADLTTDYGDVEVAGHAGSVKIVTDFGDVDVASVAGQRGPVEVFTDYGDVTLTGAEVAVKVESGFGDLRLRGLHGPVDARTDYGDVSIELTPENPGPVAAFSDFGDVTLAAGPGFTGEIEASTDFGDVGVTGPGSAALASRGSKDFRLFTMPQTGPATKLETDFGDVRLRLVDPSAKN